MPLLKVLLSYCETFWTNFQAVFANLLAPWLLMTLIAPLVALAGACAFSSISHVPVFLILGMTYAGWSLVFVATAFIISGLETYGEYKYQKADAKLEQTRV